MQKIALKTRKHSLVLFNPDIGPLSGATTLGKSRPGSDGNESVLRTLQSFSITGNSPSNSLVSYQGHSLGVLHFCKDKVGVFYSPSRLGKSPKDWYKN